MPSTPSVIMCLRLKPKAKTAFMRKASRYGGASEVLRELVEAFLDDRLSIQPDPKKETLYES